MKNVLKATVFLTDMGLVQKMNQAYIAFFTSVLPARSCVQVTALPVEIHLDSDGKPLKAIMTQQKPSFGRAVEGEDLIKSLGLAKKDFIDEAPLQVVSTGVPFLMVPVTGMDIRRLA